MAQNPYIINKVIYVDGFAGPGEHKNGDVGSPLIAYRTAVNHKLINNFKVDILMIFIEENKKYAKNLEKRLTLDCEAYKSEKVKFLVFCNQFEEKMKEVLEDYGQCLETAMLIFADPFGYKGVPMDLMQKLVIRYKTEVFINVMYGAANRWFKPRKNQENLSRWLGMKEFEWKSIVFNKINTTPVMRLQSFINLYIKQLTKSETKKYYLKFAMKNEKNRHLYHLVFVTGDIKGIMEMKRAMTKYSQTTQDFLFSEWAERGEGRIPSKMSDIEIVEDLKNRVLSKFTGKQVVGSKVEQFIWLETPYAFNVKNKLKKVLEPFWWDLSLKVNSKLDNSLSKSPGKRSRNSNYLRRNTAFHLIQFNFIIGSKHQFQEQSQQESQHEPQEESQDEYEKQKYKKLRLRTKIS